MTSVKPIWLSTLAALSGVGFDVSLPAQRPCRGSLYRYCPAVLLIANAAIYHRNLRGCATALITLETYLHRLPWRNSAVPIQVARAVGVVTTKHGIPAVGDTTAIAVGPIYRPAIDRAAAGVGNTQGSRKAIIPLVAHQILTVTTTCARYRTR